MDQYVVLSVGDNYHLRLGKDNIIQAGMPSERAYSIVQRKHEFPSHQGYAWNLFFPREQHQTRIDATFR
jgi:hypothetical protein